jgi:CubicO group peptidase (beta-lactamase class C family)
VEVASGQPYDRYVEDHIFKPAGMTGSGYVSETVEVPGRVVGYAEGAGGPEPAKLFQVIRGTPAGGSYSTGPDMIRFADALMGERLLNAAYLEKLTRTGTKLPNGAVGLYDFGGHHTGEGQIYVGHGGAAPGQNGVLHIFPDRGYVVVVLANRDPPAAERLAKFIEGRTP